MAPSTSLCCATASADIDVCHRAVQQFQLLSKSLADPHRGLRSSKIWLFYQSSLIASWDYSCRVWKHPEVIRSTGEVAGVSGKIVCCFQTNLHLRDAVTPNYLKPLTKSSSRMATVLPIRFTIFHRFYHGKCTYVISTGLSVFYNHVIKYYPLLPRADRCR
jgi:hypothetical protein